MLRPVAPAELVDEVLKMLAVEANVSGVKLEAAIAPRRAADRGRSRHPPAGAPQPRQERRAGDAERRAPDDCVRANQGRARRNSRRRIPASASRRRISRGSSTSITRRRSRALASASRSCIARCNCTAVTSTSSPRQARNDVRDQDAAGRPGTPSRPAGLAARRVTALRRSSSVARSRLERPSVAVVVLVESYENGVLVRALPIALIVCLAAWPGACAKARAHAEVPMPVLTPPPPPPRNIETVRWTSPCPPSSPGPSTRRSRRRRRVRRARPPAPRPEPPKGRTRAHRARAAAAAPPALTLKPAPGVETKTETVDPRADDTRLARLQRVELRGARCRRPRPVRHRPPVHAAGRRRDEGRQSRVRRQARRQGRDDGLRAVVAVVTRHTRCRPDCDQDRSQRAGRSADIRRLKAKM